ncbi:ABC-type sugar transport system, substrate-binding protein, contains N-terminal xre family HTH domain [Thermomonospora echinospora]|uniref:ABC-type sugar transport system, substrate-binding protein, contains N-terminal xre family HTH domain n=1 Tax=Thermomonospora echinospora TaxID=1992 RepID=A0A1H6E2X4_9ACTN|nr:substrate-binding domain-containing protein [Thermomonospora echinospora]SEG91887.1 ABC-type sugar transport system, substrate-binding protein, contains N-terminal xre family HTH domain [Thermomonospora echinospora]
MTRGRLRAGATLVAAMVLLTACGGGEGSAPSGATGPAAATNQEAAAEVKALLAGDVEFPMPTEPVNPGAHRVAVIASGLASPGPSVLAENSMEAIKAIGWTADPPGDGKFTPTTQAQLIEKAVLDKVDGIILVSITPSAVAAAVKAADDAGIPVVCALCGPDLPEGMVGVGNDHKAAGRAQAAYAASLAKPGDTIVVYQNTEFKQSEEQMAEAAAAVKEMCPDCKVKTPSLLLAEAMQPNAPIFTSLLNDYRKGSLSSVVMPFDSPASVLANSAAQLGRDDFAVIGLGALSPFVDMVGTGRPAVAKADVLISTPLYGWASVDELARMLAGAKTWAADRMPVALVDQETYGNYEKGKLFVLPKFDYKAKFTELWGR